MIKVLNLYAGIGGNRKLWEDVDITAVELNPEIAKVYSHFFPQDKMIVADAHAYLLKHFAEFDFIWSSPPCPTHSRTNTFLHAKGIIRYPDMCLYQEIIFLKQWFKGKFAIENVISYYEPLIKPVLLGRHYFWANFFILPNKEYANGINVLGLGHNLRNTKPTKDQFLALQKWHGFNLSDLKIKNSLTLLHNCVYPPLAKYVFDCAFKIKQSKLNEIGK